MIVLPPQLRYEHIETEAVLDGAMFQEADVRTSMMEAAMRSLREAGCAVVQAPTLGSGDGASGWDGLVARSVELLRPGGPGRAIAELSEASGHDPGRVVLVHHVRVKVGPRGTWDPNSGAITSPMSSAHFRAALIRCMDGEVLWRSEVFLRQVPRAGNRKHQEAIQSLYSSTLQETVP
ncbi:MAG: hypothetical protein KF833_11190 [Verrucomicrobiae bacterium]|nr:hypothetical protein [Verrucomicrobiae bacterium]